MYDIPGVANVTASLGGTSYVWVKVHYYTPGTLIGYLLIRFVKGV